MAIRRWYPEEEQSTAGTVDGTSNSPGKMRWLMHPYDKPLQAPETNDQAELGDLVLLLDTITATGNLWEDLPEPLPLF